MAARDNVSQRAGNNERQFHGISASYFNVAKISPNKNNKISMTMVRGPEMELKRRVCVGGAEKLRMRETDRDRHKDRWTD